MALQLQRNLDAAIKLIGQGVPIEKIKPSEIASSVGTIPSFNYQGKSFQVELVNAHQIQRGTYEKNTRLEGLSVITPLYNVVQLSSSIGSIRSLERDYLDLLTKSEGIRQLEFNSIAAIWWNDEPVALPDMVRRAGGDNTKEIYNKATMPLTLPHNQRFHDGVWHHLDTSREIPIQDAAYPHNIEDAPILALGNNVSRVVNASPQAAAWYEENPPPMRPRYPQQQVQQVQNTYQTTLQMWVRALRSYMKKFALEIIENGHWVLFWRGYLYTNGTVDFRQIFRNSKADNKILADFDKQFSDKDTIAIIDAKNNKNINTITWGELKNATQVGAQRMASGALGEYLRSLSAALEKSAPTIFTKKFGDSIDIELFHALCESQILTESLTYNQMLTATAAFWRTRLRNARQVHTHPPSMVMLQDGTIDLNFHFQAQPSTEGKPHNGYVKFVPEIGKTNYLDKLKQLLGKAAHNIQRFFGKKVPPQILKGSQLRKMLVNCSCDCLDFKYRMSWAGHKYGVVTDQGRTDNGQPPNITNPAQHPGFCKHLISTVRYLTDDAEIEIEKELSPEQLEALRKDREEFMKQAMESYQRMEAPAAEEEAPEMKPEEEPAPMEYGDLPPPPKPAVAPQPQTPAAPNAPPSPNYPVSQS